MRLKYIIIGLLTSVGVANAQIQNYVLKTPDDASKTYVGRDYVKLLPGYSFKAEPGKEMKAQVKKTMTSSETDAYLGITNSSQATAINTSNAVGEIPISSSVSPTGAKCYNVPIEIVPGRQGFQPNISLFYNSQAGNGVVGMGWSISGLSSIERTNSNYFFDLNVNPIDLTKNDCFTLDGMRLVEINRTDTQLNFETVKGNVKVIAFLSGDVVKFFKVLYSDGTVGVFGYEDNTISKLSYPITTKTDLNGSKIVYTYTLDTYGLNISHTPNETYYIDEINYGACSNQVNFAKVKFGYTNREDDYFFIQSGRSISMTKRLSQIDCSVNSNIFRSYSFNYSNNDPRTATEEGESKLKQINCISGTRNLNPLKFYYGETGKPSLIRDNKTITNWNYDPNQSCMMRSKFDGDIQTDAVLIYPKKEVFARGDETCYISGYSSDDKLNIYQGINSGNPTHTTIDAGDGFIGIISANIDKDNHDELIKINTTLLDDYEQLKFSIYKPYTTPGSSPVLEREDVLDFRFGYYNSVPSIVPKEFYTGNFTGTGSTEILVVPKSSLVYGGDSEYAYLIDINDQARVISSNKILYKGGSDLIFPIDIDGDGKTEIVHIKSDKTYLYKYNSGQGIELIGNWSLKLSDFSSKQVFLADVNGDNKIDIIRSPAAPVTILYPEQTVDTYAVKCSKCGAITLPELVGAWTDNQHYECGKCRNTISDSWVNRNTCILHNTTLGDNHYCSKCMSTIAKFPEYPYTSYSSDWTFYYTDGLNYTHSISTPFFNRLNGDVFFVQDLDGDDVPELILNRNNALNVYPYRGYWSGFTSQLISTCSISPNSQFIPFDINSDRQFVQAVAINSSGVERFYFSKNNVRNNMISAMVNSKGIVEKMNYGVLYNGGSYTPGKYIESPDASWNPNIIDYSGPLWVTTQNSILFNKQIVNNSAYHYNSALYHTRGLGFLGFQSITITDLLRNKSLFTEYDHFYQGGAVVHQLSDEIESYSTYDASIETNRKLTLNLSSKEEHDLLKGNTVTTTYSGYDSYGNPGTQVVDYGDEIKSTIGCTYENRIKPDIYLIGLLTNKTITNDRPGKTFSQSEGFVFGTDNRLQYHRKYIGTTFLSETEYQYYPDYGTLKTVKQTNKLNGDVLESSYTYDTDQCSLLTRKDPLGLTTTYKNNLSTRLLTDVTDYLGNKVSYDYDNWRRLYKETRPNTTVTEIKWDWNSDPEMKRLIKETITSTGQPMSYKYSDGFGRETRSTQVGFDGAEVFVDQEYDTFGRLQSSTMPYKSGSTPLLTTYSYDGYDRLQTVSQPSGSTTSYSYNNNTVSETKDGVATSKTTDVLGQLISSTDKGGEVIYTYRADGQPESINTNGVTTTMEYNDPCNRQTRLIDPSAGTIQTFFDDIKHEVTQVWNSGKTITTIYNKYGQLVTKTTPDFISTYGYENGKFKRVTSTNGTSKEVVYDGLGRLWKVSEIVNSKSYNEEYGYDPANGRLQSVTYAPLDYIVNYKYQNGYLYRLEDASGNKIREVSSINNLGEETEVTFGNGLTTRKSYTPEGLWQTVQTVDAFNVPRQDMTFDFNRVNGSLKSRTDNKRNLSENFTYGDLFRLTQYGLNSNPQTVSYKPNGNVEVKSDAGTYGYADGAKPYTLTGIADYTSNLADAVDASYTVKSRPTSLIKGAYSGIFTYNDDYDRSYMQISQSGSPVLQKYYFADGRYEVVTEGGVEKQRLYLDGSPYTASVMAEKTSSGTHFYYLHRDYLGSVTQITDENGNLAAEYSYDAWGRMRDKDTWQTYSPGTEPSLMFGRGYTGHEHLNQFGLINMNARLYDPVLGRFLAPDPFVSSPDLPNGYNRYMYARNNPLMFIDPSGETDGYAGGGYNGGYTGGGYIGGYTGGGYNYGLASPNYNSSTLGGYQSGGYWGGGTYSFQNDGFANGWGGIILGGLQWLFSSHHHSNADVPKASYSYSRAKVVSRGSTPGVGAYSVYSGGKKRPGIPAFKPVNPGSDVGQRITRLKQIYQDFDPSISIKRTEDVFISNSLRIEDYVKTSRYKGKTDAEIVMNAFGFVEEVRWGNVSISENTQTTSLGPISYGFREDLDNSFNNASILEYSRETNNGLTVGRTFYLKKTNINLRLSAPKYRTIYPIPFYMRLLPAIY